MTSVGLYFGNVLKTEQALHKAKTFLHFVLPHWCGDWECLGACQETQRGQVAQTDQRDIPDHKTSCSVYKVQGRRRRRGDIWSDVVCLYKSLLHMMRPWSPGNGQTLTQPRGAVK